MLVMFMSKSPKWRPEYICELPTVQEGVGDLRSVHNVVCLKEPRTKLVTRGDRSFEKAGACLWNCTLCPLETLTL